MGLFPIDRLKGALRLAGTPTEQPKPAGSPQMWQAGQFLNPRDQGGFGPPDMVESARNFWVPSALDHRVEVIDELAKLGSGRAATPDVPCVVVGKANEVRLENDSFPWRSDDNRVDPGEMTMAITQH